MLAEVAKATVVVTNYHAFQHRETMQLSRVGRAYLQGNDPEPPQTRETDGQMLERACGKLLAFKNIVVLNDEAHHCYRQRELSEEEKLDRESQSEAKENNEAARLWISGVAALKRKVGLRAVYDLSATPFFLRGSGYREGTLFPWVVSDFALMDAIECGIVKVPRVPVSDNALGLAMPAWRNLWHEIRGSDGLPKEGRRTKRQKGETPDPEKLPEKLLGALHALYEHYQETFTRWQDAFVRAQLTIPPVFIVVCQNTSHSKLLYDYIAGYTRTERTPGGEEREVVV